ncbi:uncharacterized protein [Periplaneta americana]|uniref:uncharacterized protein n=1 Tax=Periplaneta americana TaxID=6978 RepID=UPI0037E7AFA6
MHCPRSLLRWGLQVLRRQENRRLLSLSPAVTQIVKSAYPDVPVPTVSLPEYVWSRIDEWPDKVAIECGVTGRHYRYAEARELSRRFAASLYRIGLQAGDTIAIIMPNSPEWPIVFLGALEAGIIVTTINPIYTADEMSHQLRDSGAKAIVTISMIHSTITKAVKIVAGKTNPLVIIAPGFEQGSDLPAGTIDLMDMLQDGIDTSSVRFRGDTNDLAVLLYSSGTTGLPKGVMLSQRNLAASSVQYNSRTEICPCQPANGAHQDLSPIISPFYHIFGMCLSLLSNMYYGVKLVTMPKFEPKSFVKLLEHHDVNFMYVTPPLLLFMASYSGVKPEHLRSLRHVLSGAAPLGKLDIERFLEKAPKSPNVVQGYGLTESGGTTTIMEKDGTKYESVGGPIPNTEVKVWHVETGLDLGHQEVGEVCIRGPQVMKGYFNRPDATAEAIDGEGWLHTGDLGYYDEEGKFYIVDRSKELIKVKGFQVAPAELEEILRSHPHIEDAAVVGIPDERSGEIPKAFVVPKEKKISEEEVKKFVAEKVSDYKHLKGGVEFISSIPKSPSGKILRRLLKERR